MAEHPADPVVEGTGARPPNPAGPGGRSEGGSHPAMSAGRSPRLARLADHLPDWAGSIRFRLTVLYSVVLFGLAALMVTGLYAVLAARLNEEKVYVTRQVTRVEPLPGGFLRVTPTQIRSEYRSIEALANDRALGLLRSYSLWSLGLLFLASLVVGWMVAGRVLAPIGRITAVARDIQATDLSRRIALGGPPDELKELADTFDAMLSRLDDAFEGQRRFIQEASHELRNPLAVIRTNLDVALADPDADAVELRRTAELVGRSSERMSHLIDDLLLYARRGAPAHEIGAVDLADVVTEAVEEFRAPAAVRHLTVTADARPGLIVLGDRIALRRALANLVTNAVRLAPSGTTITVGAGRTDQQVWVAVGDEGPGVPEEERALVFQRFWRGNGATAREDGRSGLGLSIVEQIAVEHGGTVRLDPSPAGGSVFSIWLPVPLADAVRTGTPADAPADAPAVVGDEPGFTGAFGTGPYGQGREESP